MSMTLTTYDLAPNWYALAICILKRRPKLCDSPEMAFALLDKRKGVPYKVDVEIETLVELKQIMTYKEIGKIFGLKTDAVYSRIRRYKEVI
jgi:hypothetical protein